MSGAACKAALCNGCLESILDRRTREDMHVLVELIAGGNFSDGELGELITIGDELQKTIETEQAIRAESRDAQKKAEREARRKIRKVMLGR